MANPRLSDIGPVQAATQDLDAALYQTERQHCSSQGQARRRARAAAADQPNKAVLLNLFAAVMAFTINESIPAFSINLLYLSDARDCPIDELTDEEILQLRTPDSGVRSSLEGGNSLRLPNQTPLKCP